MEDIFELPVKYKDREMNYPARLVVFGYSHRIIVWVDEQEIFFEPDEEKNYRAMVNAEQPMTGKLPEVVLLQAIAAAIESLLR